MDAFTVLMLVFLVLMIVYFAYAVYVSTGKRKQKTLDAAEKIREAKLKGTYKTPKRDKILGLCFGVFLYLIIGFLVTFSSPSWLFLGLEAGLVVGVLVSSLSLWIGSMAEQKGRSFAAFFWLSLLFSPVIMGIIVATVSPQPTSSKAATSAPSFDKSSTDPAAQLKKLGSLKDEGLITAAEFEAKKKELLDRI